MSFFIDWWWLILQGILGAFTDKKLKHKPKWFLLVYCFAILTVFYIVSAGMYANLDFVMPLLNWLRSLGVNMGDNPANIGFHYMINSGVFSFNASGGPSANPVTLFWSIIIFSSYPFWLWLGIYLFKRFFHKSR